MNVPHEQRAGTPAASGSPDSRSSWGSRHVVAQVGLILAGLAIMVAALIYGVDPSPSCRGEAMTPGATCTKADQSAGQSYELLRSQARIGAGVMAGTGALVTAFGVVLLVQRRRVSTRSFDSRA